MRPLLLLALLGCDPKQADSSADTGACEPDAPGRRLVRRLSHAEYNSTVVDLLGTALAPADGFAADDRVEGFDNNADALDVSALLADDYRDAAEELAEEADLAALLPCSPEVDGERACAETFLRSFGLRAFRRPLTDDDATRYLGLYDEVAAEDGFEEGVRWLIAALLQSPHFLYRMELGAQTEPGRFELSDWEIATELSYLLVGTMPDDELLDAAAAGTLRDPAGLAEQAARLAADPRATGGVANFVFDWLGLDELETVSRDAELFPDLSDDVRVAMAGETSRLVVGLAGEDATLSELLLADHTWLNAELAAYYGLTLGTETPDEAGFVRTALDGSTYGGLLTQGSVLVTHAQSDSSGPIHRGVLVRELVLCEDLPPPPANLDITPPVSDGVSTTRELYAQHSSDPSCSGCHQYIDPIGFGFEHFTGAGQWRDTELGEDIDASGEIVDYGGTEGVFYGVRELSALLATSDEVQRCFVRKSLVYATGLDEDDSLSCAAEDLAGRVAAGEITLMEPVLALLEMRRFTVREGSEDEGDTPAQ